MFSFQLLTAFTLPHIILTNSNDISCGPSSCNNQQQCIEGDDCYILCNGINSCQFGTIMCPKHYKCTLQCSGEFACNNATIHAEMSSELNINGCTDHNACSLLDVYCPSYSETEKKCKISGNNNIRNGVHYYAVHGFSDLSFNYTGDYAVDNMNIYCLSDYTHSCVVADDSFTCDPNGDTSCNDGLLFISTASTNTLSFPISAGDNTTNYSMDLGSIFGMDILSLIIGALVMSIICVGCLLIRYVERAKYLKVELDKVSTFSYSARDEVLSPVSPVSPEHKDPPKTRIFISTPTLTYTGSNQFENNVKSMVHNSPISEASPRKCQLSPRFSESPQKPYNGSLPQYQTPPHSPQQRYLMPQSPYSGSVKLVYPNTFTPQSIPYNPYQNALKARHSNSPKVAQPHSSALKVVQPPHVQVSPPQTSPKCAQHYRLQYPIQHHTQINYNSHYVHSHSNPMPSNQMRQIPIIQPIGAQQRHLSKTTNDIRSETTNDVDDTKSDDDSESVDDNNSSSPSVSTSTSVDSQCESSTDITIETDAPSKIKGFVPNIDVDITKNKVVTSHNQFLGRNTITNGSEMTPTENSNDSPQTSVMVHGSPSEHTNITQPTRIDHVTPTEHSNVTMTTMIIHDTPSDNATPQTMVVHDTDDSRASAFPETEISQ